MQYSTEFDYDTTLNGGVVTVVLNVTELLDEYGIDYSRSLKSVYFDCTEVTSILSEQQLSELEMEADAAWRDQ